MPRRVLLVDDDQAILGSLGEALDDLQTGAVTLLREF